MKNKMYESVIIDECVRYYALSVRGGVWPAASMAHGARSSTAHHVRAGWVWLGHYPQLDQKGLQVVKVITIFFLSNFVVLIAMFDLDAALLD